MDLKAAHNRDTSFDGFTIEYHPNGVIVYRITNVQRATVDYWATVSKRHEDEALAQNRHLMRLMDVRGAGYPTPYATSKAFQVVSYAPDTLRESVALLLKDSVAYTIFKTVMSRMPKAWISNTQMFIDEQAALDWLQKRALELGE